MYWVITSGMGKSSDYIRVPNSQVRLEVILSLMEGAKPLSELQSDIQRRNTTILHALDDLAEIDLTEKVEKDYKLTSLGVIEGTLLKSFSDMTETLEKFQDFWLSHDVSAIPPELMLQIGALKNSRLIKTDEANLDKVHSSFLEILRESRTIYGISPIFHMDFVSTFKEILDEGAKIEVIANQKILEELKSTESWEVLLPHIKEGRMKFLLGEDLPVAMTVTDKFLSLGLFNLQGSYDYSTDLVSSDPRALEWGENLYKYYRREAAEI